MKPNKFTKVLTVTVFSLLLTGFVAYRTGTFENLSEERNIIQEKKLSENLNSSFSIDSPRVKNHTVSPSMMSTSKSLVLTEQKVKFPESKTDTTKKDSTNKKVQPKKTMMWGTKAAYMYNPEPDSTDEDSVK